MEVWLSDHSTLTYLPEPGIGVGVMVAIVMIAAIFSFGRP